MVDREVSAELRKVKEEKDLTEIAVFDLKGNLIGTTQDDDFKADESIYSVLSGAVNVISKSYNENTKGITIELEDTEFFLHHVLKNGEPKPQTPIIAMEYPPVSLERKRRKGLVEDISDRLSFIV